MGLQRRNSWTVGVVAIGNHDKTEEIDAMTGRIASWKSKTAAVLLVLAIPMTLASDLYAAGGGDSGLSWGKLIMGLMGGLALFLYGMEKMSSGMKRSAGNRMRTILAALTRNRVIGLLVGAFVTMVIQSSSATTVMLVSFVQAGLMSFVQSLGVILGADIGTTVTAQLIAFKLTDYALLMIAVGFGLQMFASERTAGATWARCSWVSASCFTA
jgi:phosphate:Na+ symporter